MTAHIARTIISQLEAETDFRLDTAARERPRQALLDNALERAGELAVQARFQESAHVLAINYRECRIERPYDLSVALLAQCE